MTLFSCSLSLSLCLFLQTHTHTRSGHLNLWVVVEVANPDPYGSEADLGLVPGGRVKLVNSTSIDVTAQPARRGTERYPQLYTCTCTRMYMVTTCMYMYKKWTRINGAFVFRLNFLSV